MRNVFLLIYVLFLMLVGCQYGINEKTTHIGYLNTTCLSKAAWLEIRNTHSTNSITDSTLLNKMKDFKDKPFQTYVLYFKDFPCELIGVEYSSVRYIYNPLISDQVLDGLSAILNHKEKKRIVKRIQLLLVKYQCERGVNESFELMK